MSDLSFEMHELLKDSLDLPDADEFATNVNKEVIDACRQAMVEQIGSLTQKASEEQDDKVVDKRLNTRDALVASFLKIAEKVRIEDGKDASELTLDILIGK